MVEAWTCGVHGTPHCLEWSHVWEENRQWLCFRDSKESDPSKTERSFQWPGPSEDYETPMVVCRRRGAPWGRVAGGETSRLWCQRLHLHSSPANDFIKGV